MKYKEFLHQTMLEFAKNPKVRFIGYNTQYGPKMNGTLEGCEGSCIETPCAENLMVGIAMGLALEGFLPVLCFERMDFMLAAADALINSLVNLSPFGLNLPIIIRACVGDDKPLDPGPQHKNDYTEFFRDLCPIRLSPSRLVAIHECGYLKNIMKDELRHPIMFVEYRRFYDSDISTQ